MSGTFIASDATHPPDINFKRRKTLAPIAAYALIAAATTCACYRATGPSLGLFFGGFIVATILAPSALLSQPTLFWRIIAIKCVSGAIAIVWLAAVFLTPDTPLQWLQLTIALITYSAAIASVAAVLARINFPTPIAAALAVLIGLAWVTWPIWLSSTLASAGADRLNAALVSVHPPLTANGVLKNESPWTEKPLAYRWTNLNQDIPAQLPATALPCIIFHAIVAGVFLRLSAPRRASPILTTPQSR